MEGEGELGSSINGGRLLFFSLPLQGHMTPMLHLAAILHSKGFSISFIHTKFNAPNSSKYPQFTFHPLSDHLSESETAGLSVFDLAYLINDKCSEPFRDLLTEFFTDSSENRPYALFSDPALTFTRDIAKSFALPRFVLRTSGIGAFLVYSSFPLLQEKHYLPIQASQLEQSVGDLPPLRVKDLPAIGVPDMETFTKYISELVEEAKTSSGVIFNSFEELEDSAMAVLRQTFPVPIYPIGPFHLYSPPNSSSYLTPDRTSISWLDKQAPKSVIFVSFGSVASLKQRECLEIAWGLANSGCHFLWVIRPGSISGMNRQDALPEQFMDMVEGRGYIVEWAPQHDVLAHPAIGAFWTHCGWNSTLESICEGVPMICTPRFADQMVNCRYATNAWTIGVELRDGLERDNIAKVVRRLMVEEEGLEIRQRALDLKMKAKLTVTQNGGGASFESLKSLMSCLSSSS
ncbi:UDP-glycosyltransferase 76B1-like [Andrographis paniculata]|uniref:UDP-glycosyltransferase 76B1-like n=1 Tax=Andrographis paniculata TaxID=175694 RepID=UPI002184D9EA|nr:UDP-glycosyltransferase 76B1-like [Andrographis paniculata]XP_051123004.1 UDP-glycosyltransferase 76B1-like [Andrographis paniculata]XP_051123005.1 UDP-glycosyltransferase 76B1-like [Andrographis paniculata]XP_051123006.1 UDP-glycosyltransferase 76B1-like [Andrographis paniculata]QDA11337.1 UDP-glycosyltransferase [Andrographis paniculata]